MPLVPRSQQPARIAKPTGRILEREQRFVASYLANGHNATAAARDAGYSGSQVAVRGHKMLRSPRVKAELDKRLIKALAKAELTADRVLEELRRIAFFDPRSLFDADGNLIPYQQLPAEVAAAVAPIEVIKKNLASGDGLVDTVHKVKALDKVKALETLCKHFGLLAERVQADVSMRIAWADQPAAPTIDAETVPQAREDAPR